MPKKRFNILIVDDNPTNIDLLRKFLEHDPYRISAVTSGQKALNLIEKSPPDIILLDIMMPEMDGYQVCEIVKSKASTKHIPIIFVTAKAAPEDISKGFEAGGDDYICKPAHEAELLARVNNQVQVVERRAMAQQILMDSEKLSSLGALVGGIAHEIATPLSTITLALGVLEQALDKITQSFQDSSMSEEEFGAFLEEATEARSIASRNIDNAKQIMDSFKLVAIDQIHNKPKQIQLKEYVEAIIFSLRPIMKKTQHEIRLDIPDDITLELQGGALSQVLINLINNALLHGFEHLEHGVIEIKASIDKDRLAMTFSDNGCGISPDLLETVFEEFYTTKADSGGSGLGLNIVKHLIEKDLAGRVAINSTQGKGCSFDIVLPLTLCTDNDN
jgi:signal transduction histidine kinase